MMVYPNIERVLGKTLKQPIYAVRTALKRIGSGMSYRFGGGRSCPPESVTLFLTRKCNLHCRMCGQWGEGGVTKNLSDEIVRDELPLGLLKERLDEMAAFSPSITLFGGEPLLYGDCIELIKHIKESGMHCLIITNGSLILNSARELVASGLDEINVSLDGRADVHDRIRGSDGLFEKIMAGLEAVRDIKRPTGSRKPLVNLQCTISKDNYRTLEEMIGVAERAEADSLTFHNLIFTNKEILEEQRKFDEILGSSSAEWRGFDFEPGIDPVALRETMERIRSGKHSFRVDFYPNLSPEGVRDYYRDPGIIPSGYRAKCLSPWIVAYIFPDGEVRPCLNSTYSFGNVKNEPLLSAWNSPSAIKFRCILKANKLFPACSRCTELYRY